MASAFPNNLVELDKQGKICKVNLSLIVFDGSERGVLIYNQTLGVKFITSPEIVYLARNAGFHALFIDLEHSSLSLQTANHLCVAALYVNLTPFVRVPGRAESGFIQRVLDNGAQGVIFPHVDTPGKHSCQLQPPEY